MAARKKSRSRSATGKKSSLLVMLLLLGGAGVLVWMGVNGQFDRWQKKSWVQIKNEVLQMVGNNPSTNHPSIAVKEQKPTPTVRAQTNKAQVAAAELTTKTNLAQLAQTNKTLLQTNKVVTLAPPLTLEPTNKTENFPPGVHPVRNLLEAQIALARKGISSGCIDGASGSQTRRALMAYQLMENLPLTGELDSATRASLAIEEPIFYNYTVTEWDRKRLLPVSQTWRGKSEQERLDYETILELVAEKGHAHVDFIRKQNPAINWSDVKPGTQIKIPRIDAPSVREKAAFIRIQLTNKTLQAFGRNTNLLVHFPCSIAKKVEKRPLGVLSVVKIAEAPNYVFNPDIFPESAEAKTINRKLILPPGPNNPVGTAWIGLDRPGYGIHGSPKPEEIGRSESHGCFRLANWNAEHLMQLVWSGMPVHVEP